MPGPRGRSRAPRLCRAPREAAKNRTHKESKTLPCVQQKQFGLSLIRRCSSGSLISSRLPNIVEPAFTLFRQGLTAARVLATLDKPWVPLMLLNTSNEAESLPRSFCLVHCAVLEDQPVLCGCSVPKSQNSPPGPGQQGPSEQQLQGLIASLGIRELNLPPERPMRW